MSDDPRPGDPRLPASDEADPDDQTTPAGRVDDLDELADDTGAETAPDADTTDDS